MYVRMYVQNTIDYFLPLSAHYSFRLFSSFPPLSLSLSPPVILSLPSDLPFPPRPRMFYPSLFSLC